MKHYSVLETAELLNRSRQYVWTKIKVRKLNAKKVGKFFVINEGDLKRFIDSEGQWVFPVTKTDHPLKRVDDKSFKHN